MFLASLTQINSLPEDFFERDPESVAKDLLGKRLIRRLGDDSLEGTIVETEELTRIASSRTLQQIINQVFKQHPQAVTDALTDAKAIHFLIGQVMRATKGKADPALTNRLVHQKIDTLRSLKEKTLVDNTS